MIQVMNGQGDSGIAAANCVESDRGEAILAEAVPAETSHVECVPSGLTRPNDARIRELVEKHLDFAWRYLRRLGHCPADCDEVLQESFLVVARRLDCIREGAERSYLLQVALNIASTRRRSFSRELLRIDQSAIAYNQEPAPDPEQAIEVRQARQELDAILGVMALELRQVFVLYEIEELTTREIAAMLGLKEGTVASRLRRARSEFQRHVELRTQPPTPLRPATARRGAP